MKIKAPKHFPLNFYSNKIQSGVKRKDWSKLWICQMCDWLQDLSFQRRQSSGCTMSSEANELQLITLTVFCCSTQKKSSLFSSSVTNLQEKTVWCNVFHSLAWRARGRSLLAGFSERAQRVSEQPVLFGYDGFNLAVRSRCCTFLQNTDVLKLYISLGFISSCILWHHRAADLV